MATARELLMGAIDMHVHINPDTKLRLLDGYEAAEMAKAYGMPAVVVKCHDSISADIASVINKNLEGVRLIGGITLNESMGGFNPVAVKSALGRGAKVIWFPTATAAADRKVKGKPYENKLSVFRDGLDHPGELLPQIREICELIREADAVLATGHICFAEVMALLDVASEVGLRKVVVNHPQNKCVGMGLEEQKQAAAKGAYMEQCFNFVTPHLPLLKPADFVAAIRAVGPEQCIMATDMGQVDNFYPHEALRVFVQMMLDRGLSQENIRTMIYNNPRKLLNFED
jgi:hypothetical protein